MTPPKLDKVLNFLPTDHIPPIRYVVWALVLVLEVVGMFPYVYHQYWIVPVKKRAVLLMFKGKTKEQLNQ